MRALFYFRASDTGPAAALRPPRSDPKNLNGGKDHGNHRQDQRAFVKGDFTQKMKSPYKLEIMLRIVPVLSLYAYPLKNLTHV